jgi:long-chain acyl-CoA synthetase
VRAFVSLKDGHDVDAAALIGHCREHLAAYKVPRLVDFLDELPKTVTGKIQRVALKSHD